MGKTQQDPAEELQKTLEIVIDLLRRAKSHLAVGRGVERTVTTEPVILNAAPTFWTLTIYAHVDVALLLAFKLFDTQPRAVTILQLLSLTEKCPALFKNSTPEQVAAIVTTARNQIAGIKDSLEAISARRNRVIAHLESTAVRDPQKLEAETAVTFSEGRRPSDSQGFHKAPEFDSLRVFMDKDGQRAVRRDFPETGENDGTAGRGVGGGDLQVSSMQRHGGTQNEHQDGI